MSHTGVWPTKRKQPRTRSLAYVAFSLISPAARLSDEYGNTWQVDSWPELARIAVEGHYDVYTPPLLLDNPWLAEMAEDDHCRIMASKTGGVIGVTYTNGKQTAYFTEAMRWQWRYPDADFVARLRALLVLCGVGDYATPGALGEAIWASRRDTCVSTPSAACCHDLREHSLGGRADTPGMGRRLLCAYEIDMRSAYLSFLARVPTGTAMRLLSEPTDNRQYFAPCEIRIPYAPTSDFAPVGYRTDTGLSFPRRCDGPHAFSGWLWRDEVQCARRSGAHVQLSGYGWEWARTDLDNTSYLAALRDLRDNARNAQELDWLKRAGVSALGRQAIHTASFSLIDDNSPWRADDDVPLQGDYDAPISGWWLHMEREERHAPRVTHWWAYTLMRCRLALWERMELERKAGNTVLLSNYDGILLEEPSYGPVHETPDYGEWRQRRLTSVFIPGPRMVVAKEKKTLPGVIGEKRADYAY